MNRIQPRSPATKFSPNESKLSDLAEATLSRSSSYQSPHTLFAPLHYERNYAYPLIVWMHGPDDNENQLKRIMPLVSLRNYVAIAPRGTAGSDTSPTAFHWQQTDEHIHLAEQRVWDCLAAARERFNIAPGRIFLAGYDCGGTMAYRIAMR